MSHPNEIRAEIERTRGDLSANVNALGDAVSPSNVARRQLDKIGGTAATIKDRLMGSAQDGIDQGSHAGSDLKDSAAAIPARVTSQTRGNPLALGVIALGAGWLVGSLLPASEREVDLAQTAKDRAQPLLEEAQSVAQESMERLQEPAQEAAQSVVARAKDATETVTAEGRQAATDVTDSVSSAKESVTSDN